ncbi:hypothetical protein Tco_0622302 [Tanacetum coccineum]
MQKYTRFDAQSFYDAMIFNMDSLGKYMLELILHQQRTPQLLKQKKLMQTQEDHSNPIPALNVDSLKFDLVIIHNTCSEKEESNSETASSKSVKECSLNSETKDVHAIKYKMSKAKERCMAYFRSLHSHLQVLSKDDLKGTRIEHGFKREFMSLFGYDVDTFTRTMLLNLDQLQKQLDKDEFQEDGSWIRIQGLNTSEITHNLQHMGNSKKGTESEVKMTTTGPGMIQMLMELHDNKPIYAKSQWQRKRYFDSCTSKVDSEPPHGSNVDIPNIHECKQTLDVPYVMSTRKSQSMVAEKADISETIINVDSQMMIQKNDVRSQQIKPRTSMLDDV